MATAMGKRLEGKTIIVTGASSGIGRSTAMEFARTSPKSLKLVLTARRVDKLKEIAEEIKKEVGEGVKVLPMKLDVSNPAEVKGFVDSLPAEFKEIDVLVNNAYVNAQSLHSPSRLKGLPHTVDSSKGLPKYPRSLKKTSTSCSPPTSLVSST